MDEQNTATPAEQDDEVIRADLPESSDAYAAALDEVAKPAEGVELPNTDDVYIEFVPDAKPKNGPEPTAAADPRPLTAEHFQAAKSVAKGIAGVIQACPHRAIVVTRTPELAEQAQRLAAEAGKHIIVKVKPNLGPEAVWRAPSPSR